MADPVKRGRFITFEGGEGSGKSTQARRLAEYLKERNICCLLTREPGGEKGAEDIRALLVQGEPDRWEPTTELLLFLAARYQHYHRVIQPSLAAGTWVISDRFHDSTRVYQGAAYGLSQLYCDQLYAMTLGNVQPDLTFYLDIDAETGLARSLKRLNTETRYEQRELAFHQRVRDGFLRLAASEASRVQKIDAGLSLDEVSTTILRALQVNLI